MTVTAECSVMSQVSALILVKLQRKHCAHNFAPKDSKVARKFDFKWIAVKNLHVQQTP